MKKESKNASSMIKEEENKKEYKERKKDWKNDIRTKEGTNGEKQQRK